MEGEKIEIRESRIMEQPRLEFMADSFRPPNDRLMVSEDPYGLDLNSLKKVNEVVVTLFLALNPFDYQFSERQQSR